MKKVIISVLGHDRPGIIAQVSKTLFRKDCNIENVSQTILQTEFSGIFIASIPKGLSIYKLQKNLEKDTARMKLHIYIKKLDSGDIAPSFPESEPFVITTMGPDRKGLVAEITEIIAFYGVNVTNLQAIFKGGDDPNRNIMIYEVDIPLATDQKKLENDLREKAGELNLKISIQHRNIFEAINRI